jgi:hypothetical protein
MDYRCDGCRQDSWRVYRCLESLMMVSRFCHQRRLWDIRHSS